MKSVKIGTLLLGIIVYTFMVIAILVNPWDNIDIPLGAKYIIVTGLLYLVLRLMMDVVDVIMEE